jgi:serine/threonine protein kinase
MPLQAGARLGPYEVVELRGKGGMGEVYLARDTRLDRRVAIKVLPAEVSRDPAFKRRFEREAKTISQLQHPNVCTLHDVGSQNGVDYLVMEFLDGGTLADRLRRGPLPLGDIVRVGCEIAEAVHAAHRHGVVHRDLKPGNVMLTEAGAKVVDFGLAKASARTANALDSQLATASMPVTTEGTISGTALYMAPEVLEGKDADARSDVWALGCILFEMATGVRPFSGPSYPSLVGAILKEEPPAPSHRQPLLPRRLDWIVGRCLEKDPERRWHSARDVAIELAALRDTENDEKPARATVVSKRQLIAVVLGSVVAAVIATLLASQLFDRDLAPSEKAQSAAGEVQIRQLTGRPSKDTVHSASLSPDGEQLAFATQKGLFLQIVETGEERPLPVGERLQVLEVDWLGPTDLLFSASTGDSYGLYKTSIYGGATRKLTDGAWRAAVTRDGTRIAYLQGLPARIVTVSGPEGEDARNVLDLGEHGSVWEIGWSPDGRWLLAGTWAGAFWGRPIDTRIEAIESTTGARQPVLTEPRLMQNWRGHLPFLWTADDRLVIGLRELPPNEHAANLWQVPIDRASATVRGEPVRITHVNDTNPKDLSATQDGERLAYLRERSQNDVLVADLADGGRRITQVRQLTNDERGDEPMAWTPDSGRVFFGSRRTGTWNVYVSALEGGDAQFIANGYREYFTELSPDGASVFFWRGSDLVRVPAAGGPAQTVLADAGSWAGLGCNAAGDRCLLGERSPDQPVYVFFELDLQAGRGKEVLRVADRPPFTNWDLSPDGSRLVIGHNDGRLRIFDLATAEERVLQDEGGLEYGEFPVWSADGRGVFVDGGYGMRRLFRKGVLYVSYPEGEAYLLRDSWNEWDTHPVPSPDGKRLAFAANFYYDGNAWMIESF